ncbi:MAG: hypothetical protein GY732_07805, partial [Gammaproteobacteria bacterium]|nr:hypothetical protein [Gammaproteobacteria bacterium]
DIPSNFTLDSVSITSVVGIVAGTGGSVSINASDELVFDPGSDFEELLNGETATVTVAYTMSDDEGTSSSSTATITVTGVTNSAPVAVADGADSTENQIITVDVLSNDTDPDVDDDPSNFVLNSASITSVSGLAGSGEGTVSIVGNALVFTPGTDFDELDNGDTATVTVSYTMADNEGLSSTANAVISVNGENDTPLATPDSGAGLESQIITIDVLANDTDVDGDDAPPTFTLDSVSISSVTGHAGSNHGSVSIVSNELVFDPGTDFEDLNDGDSAIVTVAYTMSDSGGLTSISTATITVNGV